MHKLKSVRRKFIATLLFSVLISITAIIHGVFFDLDFTQIQRLSFLGFLLTLMVTFPTLLLLEWIFDLENHEEWKYLEKRIKKLEKKKK